MADSRKLIDLVSIGKAMVRDFDLLGIQTVQQLKGRDAKQLFAELQTRTGSKQDPCVLDTFRAAIAQAENPDLPKEQCQWYYWSKVRKGQIKPGDR
jgi:hypothetical protein